jgi:hypothetical protein
MTDLVARTVLRQDKLVGSIPGDGTFDFRFVNFIWQNMLIRYLGERERERERERMRGGERESERAIEREREGEHNLMSQTVLTHSFMLEWVKLF